MIDGDNGLLSEFVYGSGQGWCLSTDIHDWKGDWEGHVPEKTYFKRIRFASNGKVYKVR